MQEMLLNNINSPDDLKKLDDKQLPTLCEEIRNKLINTVSQNGGHLASNLGAVEITVALHRHFSSPRDKIVFDVGHQCYTHKLLTGRYDRFSTLRKKDGISGFPRPNESEHDAFSSGHSSTSVSAGFGIAEAKRLKKDDGYVVVLVGDGAISGGLIYEGLNNAGRSKDKIIVILNDNKMSISKNVGAMSRYLTSIRTKRGYHKFKVGTEKVLVHIPFIGKKLRNMVVKMKKAFKGIFYNSTIFEDLGFFYLGPVDGHDLKKLDYMLELAKSEKKPVLLHINTIKGKGYLPAEKTPNIFHGVSSFDIETGECVHSGPTFSSEFGKALCEFAEKDKRICAITAAMRESTGLNGFSKQFKDRFFDVGIAESHAVTFAAGLAISGMVPFFAVYSTFLQRSYDQIVHDAALQNLKVIFGIDRSGIVGDDGETHQGVFDVSFLYSIPNVTVYSPCSFKELRYDMKCAIYNDNGVVAIRYPRGGEDDTDCDFSNSDYDVFGAEDAEICVVTYGREFSQVYTAVKALDKNIKIIKFNRIKPINETAVEIAINSHSVYIYEEGMRQGGFCEHFAALLYDKGYKGKVSITAIDDFVTQATVSQSLCEQRLDSESIKEQLKGEK